MSEIDLFDEPDASTPGVEANIFGPDAATPESADVLDTTDIFAAQPAPEPAAEVAPDTGTEFTPREVQPEETVQGQFTDLFAEDNPIMEIATQRQLRAENKRGLLNTAGGQRRGELSGIQAGLEIAGKDAAIYARAAELNQNYEEALRLTDVSFQHNWNLNNQLQDNASELSYQDFQQGIQASIQTYKEQSALLLQQLQNNLDLSDKDQQELLELTTISHENTIKAIEAQGEIAKQSALEQIAARGAIEMDQLIKGSDLTIDQLIAKGDIDIGNVLTQIQAQHGYVIAEMIKGGEITIDQMVKQGDIDIELIRAQAAVTHTNKVLEMMLQKDLNIDQIAAQGGIDKDRLLAGIEAQLTSDQVKMLLNNELTLGQMVEQGDIDGDLLAQRLSTEHSNRLMEMYEAGDLTIEQMQEQGDINRENMLDQVQAQLSADKSMAQTANEFNMSLSEFQNSLASLRDAQQSHLRREEMGVQLTNDLAILGEQTAAAITLSDIDHLESLNFLTAGTAEDIKRMTVANGFTQEQQDNALENAKQEILAREDSAVVLSNLDSTEAKSLADKQGEIESNLLNQRSDLTIIENNSQFANRLIEIQAQTEAQATTNSDTAARQLQTNYLIESGSMLRQAMQEIATINTTEGLTSNQQQQAINQVRTRLQSDLDFMQELYANSPAWDNDWVYTPPSDIFEPNPPPDPNNPGPPGGPPGGGPPGGPYP